MKCTYTVQIKGVCPVDEQGDVYELVVTSAQPIAVEKILAVIRKVTATPEFQEDITLAIARELAVNVKTTGAHSGVLTECEAP